jgi:hypothetical protein
MGIDAPAFVERECGYGSGAKVAAVLGLTVAVQGDDGAEPQDLTDITL